MAESAAARHWLRGRQHRPVIADNAATQSQHLRCLRSETSMSSWPASSDASSGSTNIYHRRCRRSSRQRSRRPEGTTVGRRPTADFGSAVINLPAAGCGFGAKAVRRRFTAGGRGEAQVCLSPPVADRPKGSTIRGPPGAEGDGVGSRPEPAVGDRTAMTAGVDRQEARRLGRSNITERGTGHGLKYVVANTLL